ncbi:hypothetical protein DSO57_1038619 [Entomophthora muscae]|uniref:Uncharacterized protein n=1 Tax=Entomophthora muscae TaxID=34485 RepID=A0ACC2TWJ9_9FUNG|nr:hypothetical protein DSO57_1038619 [Entomophthora muscae]
MTRGNQREKDRERAQKSKLKLPSKKKLLREGKLSEPRWDRKVQDFKKITPFRDAAIMREKQEKAAAAKEAARLAAQGQRNSK